MGKNHGKGGKRSNVAKWESVMAKLDNELRRIKEEEKKAREKKAKESK